MNIFKALHAMSKIHDVVKPMKIGDIVKEEDSNRMFKVVEIIDPCQYLSMCSSATSLFCKFVRVRGWKGDGGKQGAIFGHCYKNFHRVSKTDRFIYHMQGQNALNDYVKDRAPTPATNDDDSDGIS